MITFSVSKKLLLIVVGLVLLFLAAGLALSLAYAGDAEVESQGGILEQSAPTRDGT